jgi:ketosteroid isomerase-like protein
MKKTLALCLAGLLLAAGALAAPPAPASITQDELVRRTQEMVDAVASGDQKVWNKYIADDAMFFDERGEDMDKATLVKGITPLPQGFSGTIKVADAKSRMVGSTAILSYNLNETEIVYGQVEHARYHQTDTWMYRNGQWQIIASQVLRYYEDPAPGPADLARYPKYAGSYQVAPDVMATVTVEGGHLYLERKGRPKQELIPEAGDIFFIAGVEGRHLFRLGSDGQVETMIDRRNNEDIVWKRVK